jgi:hypothetical protein
MNIDGYLIDCGVDSGMVWAALQYLPADILQEYKNKIAFFCCADTDGLRISRETIQGRDVIILSERIFYEPNKHIKNTPLSLPEGRYFVYIVLHEVAHVIKKHGSLQGPHGEFMASDEYKYQEKEAKNQALKWFNDHAKTIGDKPLKFREIRAEEKRNKKLSKAQLRRCHSKKQAVTTLSPKKDEGG